jgi:hypothetical protein
MDNCILSEYSELSYCPLRLNNLTLLVKYSLKIEWEILAITISRHEKPIKTKKKLISSAAAKHKLSIKFLNIPLGMPIQGSRNTI